METDGKVICFAVQVLKRESRSHEGFELDPIRFAATGVAQKTCEREIVRVATPAVPLTAQMLKCGKVWRRRIAETPRFRV